MAERLKDIYFTDEAVARMADLFAAAEPSFDRAGFLRAVHDDGWPDLELKARLRHVAEALGTVLPDSYDAALEVLRAVAPGVEGFEALVPAEYVLCFGQDPDRWERSLDALGFFTRFGSAEFAVRPFLDRDPDRALKHVHRWAADEDPGVRRLASEGTRPRLPWAPQLRGFRDDPRPLIPVLEKLRDDPSEMVRRSVANHLNDISKDHPELVLEVCERWAGTSDRVDGVVRHACRTLLKAGDRRALALFGLDDDSSLSVEDLVVEPAAVRIGDAVRISYTLRVDGAEPRLVRLEYAVEYVKADGSRSPKVFKHTERTFDPGRHTLGRNHSLADLSTRTHYPGVHAIAVIANGREMGRVEFRVAPAG